MQEIGRGDHGRGMPAIMEGQFGVDENTSFAAGTGIICQNAVSYVREPYIYPAGNVRITFDSHIRTTLYQRDFQEDKVVDIDTADRPEDMILEVKYDAFLPDVIRGIMQMRGLRQQAFSKYAVCRRFG